MLEKNRFPSTIRTVSWRYGMTFCVETSGFPHKGQILQSFDVPGFVVNLNQLLWRHKQSIMIWDAMTFAWRHSDDLRRWQL